MSLVVVLAYSCLYQNSNPVSFSWWPSQYNHYDCVVLADTAERNFNSIAWSFNYNLYSLSESDQNLGTLADILGLRGSVHAFRHATRT